MASRRVRTMLALGLTAFALSAVAPVLATPTDDLEADASAEARPAGTEPELIARRIHYIVERGDTLGGIAEDHGVTVEQIRRWNDLDSDLIRTGQELLIRTSSRSSSSRSSGGRVRHTYIVERGDTLSEIAHDFGVSVDDIVRWNRGINPDLIRVDQEVRVYLDDAPGRSSSVGSPNRGRLSVSEQLESGPGFWVRSPSRAYGTNETIESIQTAFGRTFQRYPDAPSVAIGDLSYEDGGRMRPHVSHQTGRDADIAYYTLGREDGDGFVVASPESLDVERTWYLLHNLISQGHVRYIFVDYDLQAVLYDYALRRGASSTELETWFQYPGDNPALIRHARGHDDHFHIRFDCPSSDGRCSD